MMTEENKRSPLAKISAKSTADPILRNALRYTVSAKEYEALHKYVLSRSKTVKKRVPSVGVYEQFINSQSIKDEAISYQTNFTSGNTAGDIYSIKTMDTDEYNTAAIRESLRVFMGTALGLKFWDILRAVLSRGKKTLQWKSLYFRHSISLGMILLLHRLLYRFFVRLRTNLAAPISAPFCKRNAITSRALTSRFAPAIGASLAGLALAVFPAESSRVTIALYVLTRAIEFAYNLAEKEQWIWKYGRPAWWGSWLLFPLASGQLLLAFVYDRDCFPKTYGEFILKNSLQYIQNRPEDYPNALPWPSKYTIVDNLAAMAKQNYPKFTSPILFPKSKPPFPSIAPITDSAHPLISQLSCATLHPSDPSCLRTYLKYWITVFPRLARFFAIIFSVISLPKILTKFGEPDSLLNATLMALLRISKRALRYSAFVSGAIGTSWASICLFQTLFSRSFLPEKRFFLGGFLGGLWAWIVRRQARSEFLYSMRASLLSCWQVGKKKGWWRSVRGGDVLVFVFSLALLNVVFECDEGRGVVDSQVARRLLNGARGNGWKGDVSHLDQRPL